MGGGGDRTEIGGWPVGGWEDGGGRREGGKFSATPLSTLCIYIHTGTGTVSPGTRLDWTALDGTGRHWTALDGTGRHWTGLTAIRSLAVSAFLPLETGPLLGANARRAAARRPHQRTSHLGDTRRYRYPAIPSYIHPAGDPERYGTATRNGSGNGTNSILVSRFSFRGHPLKFHRQPWANTVTNLEPIVNPDPGLWSAAVAGEPGM